MHSRNRVPVLQEIKGTFLFCANKTIVHFYDNIQIYNYFKIHAFYLISVIKETDLRRKEKRKIERKEKKTWSTSIGATG